MGDFNVTSLIFSLIGGLGLFILGIKMMGDGLQKAAGRKMREILSNLTNNRFVGLGVGTLITSIIQSSSATTVMLVGFVNAGLMSLVQAIPVIFGANIGTTVTAQIIAFRLTDYALPVVGIGTAMYLFGKNDKTKHFGEAILGFGILFLGLNIMSEGVKPIGSSIVVRNAFVKLSYNPFLGIMVGAIVTGIVQSSSVATGIILALAGIGLLDIRAAIPLVLGCNIGTCATALLASIGTGISAKRAAVAHLLFNVAGTVIAVILLPLYTFLTIHSSGELVRQIANFHTMFNIVNSFIFIGFVPLYAKIVEKMVPGKETVIERGPKHLDKNLLYAPSIAIQAAQKEILRTLKFAKEMIENAMKCWYDGSSKEEQKVWAMEDTVDELQTEITNYLIKITERELDEKEAVMIPSLLHSINDVERIADHAVNLIKIAKRKKENGLTFSKAAQEEIRNIHALEREMIDDTIRALPALDGKMADRIVEKEEKMNQLVMKYRQTHINRLSRKECKPISGLAFVDLLMNFEKIGDHLTNIAQAIQGKMSWNFGKV